MQGDPLSPTIFNVVVDAVFRHWVNGLFNKAEEKGEMGREGRHQLAVFYADDGMVVTSDPAWIQSAFNALVAIFNRVGLLTILGRRSSWYATPFRRGPETGPKRHTVGG